MLHFRLGIGEFVTGRLRDGKPVPYNLSLILLYKLQLDGQHLSCFGKYFGVRMRKTHSVFLADFCGHTRNFAEITVEKDKEKLKIMLDFLLGKL